MTSNKKVKVFLKFENSLFKFMLADVTSDGSVMMGLDGKAFKSSILKIISKDGELEPGLDFENIEFKDDIISTKITFHQSGMYKLMNQIKMNSVDRVTMIGTPIKSIKSPQRMLEILIPKYLEKTTSIPRDKDMVIDITQFPKVPLRCTIFCMDQDQTDYFCKSKKIDTSTHEKSEMFEYENKVWAWTVRASKNDTTSPENVFIVFLFGDIKYPKEN